MTRYNNPLPHAQAPSPQGRPAAAGHAGHAEPELTGWPQPGPHRQPSPQHRPVQQGYPDLGYPDHDAGAPQDPYAALRPDGYGNGQAPRAGSPDPYGLAGYTAPQSSGQGYPAARPAAPHAPTSHQPSYDPFAPPAAEGYGAQRPSPGYPPSYGGPAAPQSLDSYGGQGHGYAPTAPAPGVSPLAYSGYAAPQQPAGPFGRAEAHQAQPSADQWGGAHDHDLGHGLALDPHDYHAPDPYADPAAHGQWGADAYGEPQHGDPALAHGHYQGGHQGQHGTFDQSYAEDDALYEDEPKRSGWKKVAVLMACTLMVGGGLAYGFSGLLGSDSGEPPPVVKGAKGPAKVKPSEPGGKRFEHADSKIMGRLGEGSANADPSGVRKVPVVSVGRDGQIQPPSSERGTQAITSVPGLTVIDGLGGPPGPGGAPSPDRPAAAGKAPDVKMMTGAGKDAAPAAGRKSKDGGAAGKSKDEARAAPAKAPAQSKAEAPKKVAAADPTPAPTGPRPTGAGYVAVLASVPVSASSRIDALTQFADMQQKYGSILNNKTPDIQEANLGAKGTYHRLLVGPPGSRDSANSVCNQLKAQGYNGCWITAY